MTDIVWDVVIPALVVVDDLPPDSTGQMSFGDAGTIFVEQNRICWAASRGLTMRLSELLRQHAGLTQQAFRNLYARCREDGQPIGQTLVSEGLISPDLLRGALLRHSAESLVRMCASEPEVYWQEHVERGYAPQFTFDTVEMLLAVSELRYGRLRLRVEEDLARLGEPGRRGTGFILDREVDIAVPLRAPATGGTGLRDLLALGATAGAIARAAGERGEEPSMVVGTTEDRQSIAVWWKDELIIAVPCADGLELEALSSRHLSLGG